MGQVLGHALTNDISSARSSVRVQVVRIGDNTDANFAMFVHDVNQHSDLACRRKELTPPRTDAERY